MPSIQFEKRRRERMRQLREERARIQEELDNLDSDVPMTEGRARDVDAFGRPLREERSERTDAEKQRSMEEKAAERTARIDAKREAAKQPTVPESTQRALEPPPPSMDTELVRGEEEMPVARKRFAGPVQSFDGEMEDGEDRPRRPALDLSTSLGGSGDIRQRGRLGAAIDRFEGRDEEGPAMRAASDPYAEGGAGMAGEVAARELMNEIQTLLRLGSPRANERLLNIYEELKVAGTDRRGAPKRPYERTVSGTVGGLRIPQVYIDRILREHAADFRRVQNEQMIGGTRGGVRERGVRR